MELFRKLGLADRIRVLGLPGDHPFDVAYFTRLNAFEIARGRTPSRDERLRPARWRPATDQLPEPTHRVNQMYVERFLFEQAAAGPTSRCALAGRSRTWQSMRRRSLTGWNGAGATRHGRPPIIGRLRRQPQHRTQGARHPLRRRRPPHGCVHGRRVRLDPHVDPAILSTRSAPRRPGCTSPSILTPASSSSRSMASTSS